jgi:hypothetical protein
MKIKAKIRKFFELSWPELTELKSWLKESPASCHISPETYAAPSLAVATATADGKTICHTLVETVLCVSAYAIAPDATEKQAAEAGNRIDSVLDELGSHWGISKLLVVCSADVPMQDTEDMREVKNIRLFERVIPQATATQMVGYKSTPSTNVKYIN